MIKYIKSFVVTEENKIEYPWTSILILFGDGGKLHLDKGYVIKGLLEPHEYAYYCQFNDFMFLNGKLLYSKNNFMKEISSNKVYLHIRTGSTPFPIPEDHLESFHLHFPSQNNKIYKLLNNQIDPKKIHLISSDHDESYNTSSNSRNKKRLKGQAQNLFHPFFQLKEIYHPDAVIFSHFNPNFL
jgi:hypothetical protein